ncbi:MAG TPA: 2-oxoglutarate dehydrogenase E1 component [Candidatus Binatia bacterium]|nr:2-oxoglutarate dehydrogenase E1 component [Candidatus Binatia bacterium]
MSASDFVNRENADLIDEMYRRYARDPGSVEPEWRAFFDGLELGLSARDGGGPPGAIASEPGATTTAAAPPLAEEYRAKTSGLVNAYRDLGHLLADVNPLAPPPKDHPLLDLSQYALGEEDLDRPCDPGGFHGAPPPTLRALLQALRNTYCRTLGVEYFGLRDPEERAWLEERMEPARNAPSLERADRLRVYSKLVEGESFEQFLHVKFPGQKRFSLEGGETVIPMLDALVEGAADEAVDQIVLGMAHRGRLNVLANVVRKPYEMIFAEFEGSTLPDWVQGDGDVKYHQGYSRDHHARNGRTVHVSLTPNPSHLELVNPVVEGKVRAKQNQLGDHDRNRVMPILLHGDASFIGQGIVPETLLLTHLPGFFTGGTVHIVINNQVGFTTPPEAYRPTRYCTDIARIIECPVFHVNGDDPEMALHAIDLALGFRQRFKRDVVIDLLCYRKHGHNEADEPTFTQPVMYKRIADHPGVRALYAAKLLREGVATEAELDAIKKDVLEIFDLALQYARDFRPRQEVFSFGDAWSGLGPAGTERSTATNVERPLLLAISERAAAVPPGFRVHPKVQKQYEARVEMVKRGTGIDWGCAEMLALGALLLEGTPVRMCGEDTGRGTFSHRHAVLHDQENGTTHVPLNSIAGPGESQASFEVVDSMLSEEAVLGFEYGFSSAAPHTLTIWEAQFGDFANGAQAIVDTFIAAAESKWQRASGLVLYLPHGYEGQGPEHSSARLERWLQLCADDNLQVVYPTTAGQLFHLLRRQMRRPFRKPLVVMTPKSLLRFAPATSAVEELAQGAFQPVLPDPVALDVAGVTAVALCSGKVFYDLAKARQDRADLRVALVRVEELYPLPEREIRAALEAYPQARDVVWVQEEPRNMGAWTYVHERLPALLGPARALRYAGRDEAASPATGSYRLHAKEQAALVAAVFDGAPPAPADVADEDAENGARRGGAARPAQEPAVAALAGAGASAGGTIASSPRRLSAKAGASRSGGGR